MRLLMAMLIGVFLFSIGCAPVTISLDGVPRACTEADNRPPARPGYPRVWANPFDPGEAGYDLMFTFAPQGPANNQVVVHRVDYTYTRFTFNPATGQCDIELPTPDQSVIERFHTPARDVQWWFTDPSQEIRTLQANGRVAIVDPVAGHPFPQIPPDHNAEFLDRPDANGNVWLNGLTQQQRTDFMQRLDQAEFAQYEYTYTYDNSTPNPPSGSIHRLEIRYWDVKNGRRGRSKSSTYTSDGTDLCPEMN